jgi:predicted kinase
MYNSNEQLIIIMVGLPARGKSYISNKLSKYFRWNSYKSKVYNLDDYRRKLLKDFQNHIFFDDNNVEGKKIRDEIAINVFNELLDWLKNEDENIAIFDATNTKKKRRKKLLELCYKYGFKPLFIESICNDDNIIKSNLQMKLLSKDYINMPDKTIAIEDFKNRLEHYTKVYSEVNEIEDKSLNILNCLTINIK